MTSGLRRTKAKRASRSEESSPHSPKSPSVLRKAYSHDHRTTPEDVESSMQSGDEPLPEPRSSSSRPTESKSLRQENEAMTPIRPSYQRSPSSVPSIDRPTIPKLRKESPPATLIEEPEAELNWPEPEKQEELKTPSRLTKKRPVSLDSHVAKDVPPPPHAHRSSSSVELKDLKIPNLSPTKQRHRLSSSPLKHEYEPSTASESSSDSDNSTVEHNVSGSVSDVSSDDEFDHLPVPAP